MWPELVWLHFSTAVQYLNPVSSTVCATAMSCEVMAGAGMCHFPVRVFNTFLDGTTEGFRKIYEICGCSCRGNNEDIYDSGGVNSTCVDIIPLRANNDGNEHALLVSATGEALLDPNNLAGSRIRLGTHVDCELFTDPENQCGMTLREATGDDPLNNPVLRADVSEGAKDLKVSEWCRDLCCGRHNVTFVEDAGCGECRSESLVLTYVLRLRLHSPGQTLTVKYGLQ